MPLCQFQIIPNYCSLAGVRCVVLPNYSTSPLDKVRTLCNIFVSSYSGLNVIYMNARSLRNKVGELYDMFCGTKVHAIIVSESWLNENISSALVSGNICP